MPTNIDNALLKHRMENFKVCVSQQKYPLGPGELIVHVTHNGYQWASLNLLPHEARKVIDALNEELSKQATKSPENAQ